ncbi:MAG: CPBP family intramembrane glutamic endopeptidase, partial [Acetanaerobacterium sp.]
PPIVSYIILRRTNVFSGFKNFLSVAFHIKQPIMHYLMLPLFLLIMYVVPVLAGRLTVTGPFYIGLVMIAPMIFGGGLEELGWRLVLQPHLERKMGFVPASLLTGGLWALWHLPLFFIQGVSQYGTNFGIFAVLCLGLAFSLAAVFYISRNIWLCILLHAMYNAFSAVFTIDQSLLTAIGIVILQGAFAILLVSYTKRIQKKQV